MLDVPDPNDRLDAWWQDHAQAWTEAVRSGAVAGRGAGTDAAIVEAVVRVLPPGGRVLDMGSGEGWLSRALSALGATVHGVDASAALVEAAQAEGGSSEALSYAEAWADPARLGGPYEVAVFNFSLLDDAVAGILRAAASRLAGGAIVIQTVHPFAIDPPYADGWREETFSTMGEGFRPMPWYARTFGSWVRVLDAAGLRLSEVAEPVHPATGAPLSLVLTAEPVALADLSGWR